jgi:hypothetical protein
MSTSIDTSSNSSLFSSIGSSISSAWSWYTKTSKVYEIVETGVQAIKTATDTELPDKIKIIHGSACVTFMGSRTGELIVTVPAIKPVLNVLSTASNIAKTTTYDFIKGRTIEETTPKVQKILLSGTGETLWNLSCIPSIPFSNAIRLVGIVFSLASFGNRNPPQQERIFAYNPIIFEP